MPALDARLETTLAAVAEVAILCRPRRFAIVARTTEFAIDNLFHRYPVAARFGLEPEIDMTH